MKIYIDTEFNEFGGELISMALVSDDGQEFYEVLDCLEPGAWVSEHVMPFLEKSAVSKYVFQDALFKFLNQYQRIHIIADWADDLKYFCESLILGPGISMIHPPITMELRRDLSSATSVVPHNALHDARAIQSEDLEQTYKDMRKQSNRC